MLTLAPSRAKPRAVARPIPWLAPATSATFPFKPKSISYSPKFHESSPSLSRPAGGILKHRCIGRGDPSVAQRPHQRYAERKANVLHRGEKMLPRGPPLSLIFVPSKYSPGNPDGAA